MVMECLAVEVGALPGAQYPIADSGVSHASCVGYFFFYIARVCTTRSTNFPGLTSRMAFNQKAPPCSRADFSPIGRKPLSMVPLPQDRSWVRLC